jgi:hypothetical protein
MRRSSAPSPLLLVVLLAGGLAHSGCGGGGRGGLGTPPAPQSVEEVEAVLAELDSFTAELAKKIESAPDPVAGVRQARGFLDARRGELGPKVSAVKKSRSFSENDETRKRVLQSEVENVLKVAGLRTRFMGEAMSNQPFRDELDALVNDYQSLFKE